MTTKLKRAAFGLRKIRASRGGWAIEATGALSLLVMLIGFGMYNESRSNNRRMAEIAATHHKAVATAASAYVKDHYSDLLAAVPSVGNVTTVNFSTLGGYVQPTLSDSNLWGQTMTLRVRRSSVNPKEVQLEGLVIGEGGQAVPHDLAREVSQDIGAEGGYTVATGDYCGTTKVAENTLCGTRGVWSRPVANFGASGAPGHIVSALFFKDGMAVNDYLYRHRVPGKPELNTMETYLQMGTGAQAEEGKACLSVAGDLSSPLLQDGAIATTNTGLILSCQGGRWAGSQTTTTYSGVGTPGNCGASWYGGGLCSTVLYSWIDFPKPFSSIPIVSASFGRPRGDLAPCTGSALDTFTAYVSGVTTTGFYLYGGFSPLGSSACGAGYDGWWARSDISWVATLSQ